MNSDRNRRNRRITEELGVKTELGGKQKNLETEELV
jgi:hypothetical protein